jgi:hypothetical protein
MITLDGKPLVDEAQARLDLACEYGTLFANYRNTLLENVALATALQASNTARAQAQQARAALEEKYRNLLVNRDELANQLRGKPVKPRKV